MEKLAGYIVDNKIVWNLNAEVLFTDDVDTAYNDIIKIIDILKNSDYDLNNFRMCDDPYLPSKVIVGIDYKKDVYVSFPEFSKYYGTIDNFMMPLLNSIKSYKGCLTNYIVPDKCKLCCFHGRCILNRCTSTNDEVFFSDLNNILNSCELVLRINNYLDSTIRKNCGSENKYATIINQ